MGVVFDRTLAACSLDPGTTLLLPRQSAAATTLLLTSSDFLYVGVLALTHLAEVRPHGGPHARRCSQGQLVELDDCAPCPRLLLICPSGSKDAVLETLNDILR